MAKRKRHSYPKNPPNSKKNAQAQLRPVGDKEIKRSLLDIIIPVYGRFDLVTRCLRAIPDAAEGLNYNVILIDNNSPADEAKLFYTPENPVLWDVKLLKNSENEGFPRACNRAFVSGSSPLVLFLNDDVIMDPGSIAKMVNAMDDPSIAVAGAKLIFPDDANSLGLRTDGTNRPAGKVQHVGLTTNINGEFIHVFIGWDENNPRVKAIREIYAVTGACLMTRRHLYSKSGGFNEIYGLGTYEDIDYCLTVRDMGYTIIVEQEARGLHYAGATSESYKIGYPLGPNQLIFLQRWATKMNYEEWKIW